MLRRHARCASFIWATMDKAFHYSYCTFLELAELTILHPAPAIHTIQDTSPLILNCPATDFCVACFWQLSVSLRFLVQAPGYFQALGAPWSSVVPPSVGKDRITTTKEDLSEFYGSKFSLTLKPQPYSAGTPVKRSTILILFCSEFSQLTTSPW